MELFWKCLIINIIILIKSINCEISEMLDEKFRIKRQINTLPLVYPYGGTYKMIIGFGMPIENPDKISLSFGLNFQYQYTQIQNITELSRYYFIKTVSREQREADLKGRDDERLTFYRAVENMFNTAGINGHDCVLRAICEAAQAPLDDEGLVGEIIHILLTPDYGHSNPESVDVNWEEPMALYKAAAIAGRQTFSCGYIYPGCPQGKGILDLISELKDA